MRLGSQVSVLVLLSSAGCFHDFKSASEDHALDASKQPGDTSRADAGAGDAEVDAAADASTPEEARYRWVSNGPSGEIEEGPVTFELSCVDPRGAPSQCSFRCKFDKTQERACSGTYEVPWAAAGEQLDPRSHTFCVTVEPLVASDAEPSARSTDCLTFSATPYARGWTWVEEAVPETSTELDVGLTCSQPLEAGGTSEPRNDCVFRCSVDGVPYQLCGEISLSIDGRFHWPGLAFGKHTLRVETSGPYMTPGEHVTRVSTLAFMVADGATPPVPVVEPVTLPAELEREQLEALGLSQLLEPYGAFAVACLSRRSSTVAEQAELLRLYLSYALGRPDTSVADAEELAACLAQLGETPAPCRSLEGFPESFLDDGPLWVRLPSDCDKIVQGSGVGGDRCLTNAECGGFGACERAGSWDPERLALGFCAEDDVEYRQGIMCLTRGCTAGLFCDGRVCQLLHAPGDECSYGNEGSDCPLSYTCSGSPARCVLANARLGDTCSFNRDCREGRCEQRVCSE